MSAHKDDCQSGQREWSGSPDPANSDNEWICDECGAVIPTEENGEHHAKAKGGEQVIRYILVAAALFPWSVAFALAWLLLGCTTPSHPVDMPTEKRTFIVYDRPRGNCREMQSLLANRPIPAIHSYAQPFPVCGEK